MTNDTRLLAHLTHRFASHPEDIATEGLAFLLEQSSSMRSALWNSITTLTPHVSEPASYRTQVAITDGTRPDIIGSDVAGHEVVMIEAKFWAGLTDNQPVAYLNRLRENGSTPSALIVVAPAQRLESLWHELLRLARPVYSGLRERTASNQMLAADVTPEISLVLTSWSYLLDALTVRASSDGDSAMVSDLLQLQSLAREQDEEAFLPVRSFELGQDFPRRMVLLTSLIDDLVQKARAAGLVTTDGLRASGRSTGYGRYFLIGQTGIWVGVSFEFWGRYRATPLWLQVQKWKDDTEPLAEKRRRLQRLETDERLLTVRNGLAVPLEIPLGVERPQVLDALLEQIREIHGLLTQS